MTKPKDWIKAGGILGAAILAARATRTPLATILGAMPVLLKYLQEAEARQSREHAQSGGNTPSAGGDMTREEAALILGVGMNASEQEIHTAYRRLIQKNHPDAGGTDYLAAKVNQARDIMLRK